MKPIRVLVIDDSAFMRRMISDIIGSDDRLELVGTARNGNDGIKKIKHLSPDVVTLDVEMPIMDGITTLQKIMEERPLPVVMVSSVTAAGTDKTIQAISNGAVDFITKPSGAISLDITRIKREIIRKVVTAAHAVLPKRESKTQHPIRAQQIEKPLRPHAKTVVAIGSSTGGPKALQQILTELPADFPAPILIVQHMPAGFTKSLATRLNALAGIHVREAVHGEIIQPETAYIAPGNFHMKIRKAGTALAIELTQENELFGHRPAVDVLFESLALQDNVNKIAVVLTGMGHDGSQGIIQLKQRDKNTIVIAEAEESSIVYGMPKSAVKTNCVNYIRHLHKIGDTIAQFAESLRGK
ncbi:chemotaxis-specific protein-glutamate methyltransferase CheB [Virgibacillus dakarensis]|uniref:Protein-glutamate methylesterase/protein-glutamine glutaminase n=1 Tax=Lentibacillus populi TaxID=1827502 RepID=A0A9W5TUQ8_9BACI|nr:chemotaxis response regulator protein-glutamate methylesterase [Lentibacillus populi]MBT2216655.1 chemotaxis response regulator protein-glutamate methylesterase [Virgibacillus dakarensis]MTW84962.1 chemotaxis-specific protein-glutamate methyltransferase CheB [Virgibacillus dakarensis]GGB30451.1 chemotaxis response regulator protein-glutamate methylesterase [Lentibacillus populi]